MPKSSRLRKKIRDKRRAETQASTSEIPQLDTRASDGTSKLASLGLTDAPIYKLLLAYRSNGMFPPTADDIGKCLKLKPQLVRQSLANLGKLNLIEAAPRGGRSLMSGYRIKDFGGRTL